ncbi:MAG: sulfurtransferase, partial [Gammaproteobacteria bacterium]|nr:sulfurtransferase [Gammaproteobacteria bacterium]
SLCKDSTYSQLHIPGAVHLDYSSITASRGLTHGLLPEASQLASVFATHGIGDTTHVVAYDDEGGGNACRLLWTLETMGHTGYSLLNGGLHAWANEGHPLSREPARPAPAQFTARTNPSSVADAQYILQRLHSTDLALWDARSSNEYRGTSRFSHFAGHIPGAANLDWLEVMDRERNLRLKPDADLQHLLDDLQLTPDKEVVTYCQTHHRSSLAWFVLRYLEYPRVRGYPGSWSDWGNRANTPKSI